MVSKSSKSKQHVEPDEKPPAESIKETIDSIIVAFCLAFVFRAFIVEAFVIPTGSMADTLMGEHRGFTCADCGYNFPVALDASIRKERSYNKQMLDAELVCPNCGFVVEPSNRNTADADPKFATGNRGGDKILVLKFPYLFQQPDRWDVVVFYNPAKAEQNYIKRLIGLPGEAIQIVDGDIFVADSIRRDDGSFEIRKDSWRVQRKPDHVQEVLWRPVYLNDFLPSQSRKDAIPRWLPNLAGNGWDTSSRVFNFQPPGVSPPPKQAGHRLTFHPKGGSSPDEKRRIGFYDYYAYNHYQEGRQQYFNIVGDLMLEAVVAFREPGGALRLSLNRRDTRFTATIRQNGSVELLRSDEAGTRQPLQFGQAVEPFPVDRGVRVRLQNVDFRASVWIDGRKVLETNDDQYGPNATGEGAYGPSRTQLVRLDRGRDEVDNQPLPVVWMEASDGPLDVAHVSLYRDVYYTAWAKGRGQDVIRGSPLAKPSSSDGDPAEPVVHLIDYPSDLDANDEFFVLGDNSPSSSDGRMWEWMKLGTYWHLQERHRQGLYRSGRVPRDHLIGKAFFVYWPAGLRMFGTNVHLVPNVGRMRLIR